MYNIPYHGEKDLSGYSFLVTGGAGFIGSNLVAYLLKYGAGLVRVLDNFSSGSVNNLENFSFYPSFDIIDGDVTNLNDWKQAVSGIDIIFHQVDLRNGSDFSSATDFNVRRLNMLIAANVAGVKRIVDGTCSFLSSPGIQAASDPLSRYVNAFYADILGGMYGTSCIGLQCETVYGPHFNGSDDIVSKLISGLIAHKAISISGNAVTRGFTYIENAVQANILVALDERSLAANKIYRIEPDGQQSLSEVAVNLRDILALIDPKIGEIDLSSEQVCSCSTNDNSYVADQAEKLDCYYPYFNLKDGLIETVKFYLEDEKYSRILS